MYFFIFWRKCKNQSFLLLWWRTLLRVTFFYLYDSTQVTVGGQLQSLFLGPRLNAAEATFEAEAPNPHTELMLLLYQDVEQPHVDEVEELGEQLDGEGSIHTTPTQQVHGRGKCVKDISKWRSSTIVLHPIFLWNLKNTLYNKIKS